MNTRRAGEILLRGLKLRCPDCGQGALYRSLLQMEHHCRYCGLVYEREQGYFIGAVYLNVIATESLILITLLVYFMAALTFNQTILTVLLIMAVIVPLALFR
ncbi:MAG TPA: DUF983 domain-containing protein, partial [Blastocatellia bacterium]|nr:DUF983 domain-containing protein [Blastocatellia bacterium]